MGRFIAAFSHSQASVIAHLQESAFADCRETAIPLARSAQDLLIMAPDPASPNMTPVNYEHSPGFVPLLTKLGDSLSVSTYQAGEVISAGVYEQETASHFLQIDQAMELALSLIGLRSGSRRQLWSLVDAPDSAKMVTLGCRYDVAFLIRQSTFTGPIMGHEMAWGKDRLRLMNKCRILSGPLPDADQTKTLCFAPPFQRNN